jgi:hypothetical protein
VIIWTVVAATSRYLRHSKKKAGGAEQTSFPGVDLYKVTECTMHQKITITLATLLLLGTTAVSFAQGGGGGAGGAGGAGAGAAGGASGGAASGGGTGGAAGTPGVGAGGSMNSNPGTSGSTSDTLNKKSPRAAADTGGAAGTPGVGSAAAGAMPARTEDAGTPGVGSAAAGAMPPRTEDAGTPGVGGAAASATPARAEEKQDVAKDCEAKTLKAHPNKLPNTEATANLRQEYYTTCIDRGGKMNPNNENQ